MHKTLLLHELKRALCSPVLSTLLKLLDALAGGVGSGCVRSKADLAEAWPGDGTSATPAIWPSIIRLSRFWRLKAVIVLFGRLLRCWLGFWG